jgi:hypothetical protein
MKESEYRSNGIIHVGSDVTSDEANTVLVDSYVQGNCEQSEMRCFGYVPWYQ